VLFLKIGIGFYGIGFRFQNFEESLFQHPCHPKEEGRTPCQSASSFLLYFLRIANWFIRNEKKIGRFYALQTGFLLCKKRKREILVNFAFCALRYSNRKIDSSMSWYKLIIDVDYSPSDPGCVDHFTERTEKILKDLKAGQSIG
jgi:hypothetical protein